jgi:AbiV family abortive infection protein
MVTPDYLMRGMHYALEQCGLLLRDAMILYRNQCYATATMLAAFAREELGKARQLGQMRREVLAGATLTVKDVRSRCGGSHVAKQERGQMSIVLPVSNDPEMAELSRVLAVYHRESKEWQRAYARLQEKAEDRGRLVPAERHHTRMRCLYVDPDDAGTTWSRPRDCTKEEANEFLNHAANDYSTQYLYYAKQCQSYQQGNVRVEDEDLTRAMQAWPDRSDLPQPEWPEEQPAVTGPSASTT